MKNSYFKIFFAILLSVYSIYSYGQFTVTIDNTTLFVNNLPVSSGSPINLGTNNSVTVRLDVDVKTNNPPSDSQMGEINVYYQRSVGSGAIKATGVNDVAFFGSNSVTRNFTFSLNASSFDGTGGFIYAEYKSYSSVQYKSTNRNVIKTVTPPITNNAITGTQSIYYGQSLTIVGNQPTGGNGNFTYSWEKKAGTGNWAVISGVNAGSYSTGALNITTQYRRTAYSGNSILISNVVTVTVINSLPIANNSISGGQTINEGTITTINGTTPTGGSGNGSYVYQWEKKESNGLWDVISGIAMVNYTSAQPFSTTTFRRIIKSGNAVNSISNEVTINVNPAPQLLNNSIALNGTELIGSLPVGGTGIYSYSWILMGGEEPYTFPDTEQNFIIPASVYDYLSSYPNLSIYRIVKSGRQTIYSNSILVMPLGEIQNNTITYQGNLITGSTPIGGAGTYTYSWTLLGPDDPFILPDTGQSLELTPGLIDYTSQYPGSKIYRTVHSGNKVSQSNIITLFPISDIQNNTIDLFSNTIYGTIPTGGSGMYKYEWVMFGGSQEPITLVETTQNLMLTSELQNLINDNPNALIYRLVKSGNKISYSNYWNFKIQNNVITKNENMIEGSQPTGGFGYGSFFYSWMLLGADDPYTFPDTGKDLVLTPSIIEYMSSYPGSMITRFVRSGYNRSSRSNSVTLLSGRQISTFENLNITEQEQSITVKVYPNPTNGLVNFQNDVWENKEVEIIIYSEWLGNSSTIYKGVVKPNQVINWNIPVNYPKGLYFYKIVTGEEIKSGKIFYN